MKPRSSEGRGGGWHKITQLNVVMWHKKTKNYKIWKCVQSVLKPFLIFYLFLTIYESLKIHLCVVWWNMKLLIPKLNHFNKILLLFDFYLSWICLFVMATCTCLYVKIQLQRNFQQSLVFHSSGYCIHVFVNSEILI